MIEFQLSHELDPARLAELGSFTTLPVRIHNDNTIAERASRRFLGEWAKATGEKVDEVLGRSGQGLLGHLASLAMPECIPNRLGLIAKIVDYALLENDLTTSVGALNKNTEGENILRHANSVTFNSGQKLRRLQTDLSLEAFDLQPQGTESLLRSARQAWSARAKEIPKAATLEEYIENQSSLVTTWLFVGLISTGMDTTLDSEGYAQIDPIVRPLKIAAVLSDDYFNLRNERDGTTPANKYNAVGIIAEHQGISEEAALACLKARIKKEEEAHYEALNNALQGNKLSGEMQRWIAFVQFAVGGTHVWHAVSAQRYKVPSHAGWSTYATYIMGLMIELISWMLGVDLRCWVGKGSR